MKVSRTRRSFSAKLERPPGVGTWTFLTIPFDAVEEYGIKGQIRVKGTINGKAYGSSLLPHGDGSHYLVVGKPIRDSVGVTEGTLVQVVLECDTQPRKVSLPKDFRQALSQDIKVRSAFNKLPFSHQKEYVEWIESAKKPETRLRRINNSMSRISAGERLK